MFPYFELFGKQFMMYGVFIALGGIFANILAWFIIRKNNLDINDFIIAEAYSLIGAFIGAKFLYIWVIRNDIQWDRFFEPEYFNAIMSGGFVFYGGLIFGVVFAGIGCKIHKINPIIYLKKVVFLIPFAHAFGRMGCFSAGCCYGMKYDGLFSVVFPENSFAPHGVSLFPIQLFEAVLLFILSFITWIFSRNKNDLIGIYIYFFGYSIIRFFDEFLRFDNIERGIWGGLSTSQWISIFIIIVMTIILICQNRKLKNS